MYDMIKALFAHQLPFVRHTWIKVEEVGPGTATASMPDKEELKNHIGTQHAAALFGLGETASGAALASVVGERVMEVRPVATNASISFKKIARGPIVAHATASKSPEEVAQALKEEGKIAFDVNVSLRDEDDNEVSTMVVEWYVSEKKKK